jgi:hypothetical protein
VKSSGTWRFTRATLSGRPPSATHPSFLTTRSTTPRIRVFWDKRNMPARKRSFDEFAAPLPRFKWGAPYLHNNKPDGTPRYSSESIKPNMKPNYIHALKRSHDQLATVKAFLDHGVDPEKLISGLTNKIHTIFRQNCRCKYTKDCCCLWRMRRNFPEKKIRLVQVPEIASPAPRDNFFVEAMMRLATKWINSDPGRQFVSALMDCGPGGQEFECRA